LNKVRKLAGQTVLYGLGSIFPKLLNFAILTPFYTRLFAPGVYGTFTELYAYVVILMVVITFGMETGFFRYAQNRESLRSVFTTSFVFVSALSVVFVIVVRLLLGPISELIKYEHKPEYIRWFSYIIAIDAVAALPFAKLRQQEKAFKFAMIKILNVIVNIGLVVFFFVIWPKLWAANPGGGINRLYDPGMGVGYVFIANLITSAIVLLMLSAELKDLRGPFDLAVMKSLVKYSFPIVIIGIAGSINEVADKILLKFWLPDSYQAMDMVGIYGANYKIAVLMTLFIQMFRYAFEPFLFARSSDSDAKSLYARILDIFFGLGLVIFLGVLFNIDIIKYYIDPDYWDGLGIVPIILLANLFLGVFYNLSVWYKINDLTKYGAWLAVGGAIITIVLNALLIPVIGYMGSAWATLACYTLMMTGSFLWGRKIYPVPYRIDRMIVNLGAALFLFGLSLLLRPDNLAARLILNNVLLLAFLAWLEWKSKLLSVFLPSRADI
jgi:O-antigen/teichoic acid export membrane protein